MDYSATREPGSTPEEAIMQTRALPHEQNTIESFDSDTQAEVEAGAAHNAELGPDAEHFVSLALSAAFPLGSFAELPFWKSSEEYVDHIKRILMLHEKCKKLSLWCIEHDRESYTVRRNIRAAKANGLVWTGFTLQADEAYGRLQGWAPVPERFELGAETIVRQLELEVVKIHNQEEEEEEAGSAALEDVKREAKNRQVCFWQVQVHLFASAVATIIRGQRYAVQMVRDPKSLDIAKDAVDITNTGLAAIFRGQAPTRQRFFYVDELKMTIADNITAEIEATLDDEVVDAQWLSAVRDTANSYASNAAAGGIPLSPALHEEALRVLHEISEHVDAELGQFGQEANDGIERHWYDGSEQGVLTKMGRNQ